MSDISALGELRPVELDLGEQYPDMKPFQGIPKAGRYTLRTTDEFPAAAFNRTAKGAIQVEIAPTVAGPTNEGFKLRYARVNAQEFDRNGAKVSFLGDYLRAHGIRQRFTSEAELVNAIDQTAGQPFEAQLDWEARKGEVKVKGMKNFPPDGKGGYQPWVQHPTEKGEDGEALRLRANVVITRFYSKAE